MRSTRNRRGPTSITVYLSTPPSTTSTYWPSVMPVWTGRGCAAPFGPSVEGRSKQNFLGHKNTDEGWAKFNRHYWLRDYKGFLEFFFAEAFPEPHSTKQIEDSVSWALETTPETLIDTVFGRSLPDDDDEALDNER